MEKYTAEEIAEIEELSPENRREIGKRILEYELDGQRKFKEVLVSIFGEQLVETTEEEDPGIKENFEKRIQKIKKDYGLDE